MFGNNVSLTRDNHICKNISNKWIVLTTIFYPTLAVERFLSLDEWMLVVIADRKTPIDWLSRIPPSLRRKLIYLSLSDQRKLNYGIIRFLPEDSYARKNIGYLVAIQCGAKIIFESDDDNILENMFIEILPKVSSSKTVPKIAFRGKRSPFVNIYGSFGEPNIWPRGFPLQELKNVSEDGWSSLRRNEEDVHAYIQQFLADLDPDVDAIYRLANPFHLGHIKFNRQQTPIALDPFTFSPYNTQNTITYYEAFWGLFLPVTTTFRVCDIWRGFWVQRLLWDIGGRLVFAGPTVKQKRNAHSYLKDMKEEQQMYYESAAFVRFLSSRKSSKTSLFENIRSLANDIVQQGFWKAIEANYIDIWLEDLLRIGYQPSSLKLSPNKNRKQIKRRRAAVCATGRLASGNEAWISTEKQLQKKLNGEIDIFYYLSSSAPIKPCEYLSATFLTNATIQVLYTQRNLNYQHSTVSCHINSSLSNDQTKNDVQDIWAQAECYDLVTSYQKQNNIRYDLLVHVQYNSVFVKMPISYERDSPSNMDMTITLSQDVYDRQINGHFAIGPIKTMSHYMRRWYTLEECLLPSMDLEKQLAFISRMNISLLFDKETITDLHTTTEC